MGMIDKAEDDTFVISSDEEQNDTTRMNDNNNDSLEMSGVHSTHNRRSFKGQTPVNLEEVALGTEDEDYRRKDDTPNNDHSTTTHDQLPNVEEYKVMVGVNHARRRFKFFCIGSMVLIVVLISLGIGLGARNSNINNNDSLESLDNDNDDDNDNGMSHDELDAELDASRYIDAYEVIVENGFSKQETLLDFSSPQSQALFWLSKSDEKMIDMVNSLEFVQRYVLAVLYYSLGGPNWQDQFNFLTRGSECAWSQFWQGASTDPIPRYTEVGVICDDLATVTTSIQRIYLPSNGMMGYIPSEIRLLTSLREINFYDNEITGLIPTELQEIQTLEALVLYQNEIDDTFPDWLTRMPHLQIVNIGYNNIYGMLPENLNQMVDLQVLNCESCKLFGPLSPALDGMKTVQSIYLGSNDFTGPLTDEMYNSWESIVELDLGNNELNGQLPSNLLTKPSIMVVDLHKNDFDGSIVTQDSTNYEQIFENNNLRVLALHDNKFSGHIDDWVYLLRNVQHLDLSSNQLIGEIPSEIGVMTQLKYLFLGMNPTFDQGPIPTELGLLTDLMDLSLQSTNRNGGIPTELGKMERLVLLDLIDNQLDGAIPPEIAGLEDTLRFLLLRSNNLSGGIPGDFVGFNNLDTVLLDQNLELNGSTDPICKKENLDSITKFTTDCTQYEDKCPCCTLCCGTPENSYNSTCAVTVDKYDASFDPNAEFRYVRTFYQLNEDDVVRPVEALPTEETPTYDNTTDTVDGVFMPYDTHPTDGAGQVWEEYLEDSKNDDGFGGYEDPDAGEFRPVPPNVDQTSDGGNLLDIDIDNYEDLGDGDGENEDLNDGDHNLDTWYDEDGNRR